MIPLSFVVILGAKTLSTSGVDPNTVFLTYTKTLLGSSGGTALKWGVGLMLIVALALSALNAIMGCARGLYQIASTASSRRSSAASTRTACRRSRCSST